MYDADACDYEPAGSASNKAPAGFLTNLQNDLELAIAAGCPQLTVIVHGLSTLFTDVVRDMTAVGSGLQQWPQQPYGGLVISFDWPSYDSIDSMANYASGTSWVFPPPKTSGTIRDNINGTVLSFGNFMAFLQTVQTNYPSVQINFICHSEGNFMMMLGMYELPQTQAITINQTLLVAGDINNGALQSSGPLPNTGMGMRISNLSKQVTVYYSAGDDVLPDSEKYLSMYHNPHYYGRLGLEGPYSYSTTATPLAANTYGLDCSAVINDTAIKSIPQVPAGTSSHSAYFYIPQVIADWAATLTGTAPGSVANRTANPQAENGQGYVMQYVNPPSQPLKRGAAPRPRPE